MLNLAVRKPLVLKRANCISVQQKQLLSQLASPFPQPLLLRHHFTSAAAPTEGTVKERKIFVSHVLLQRARACLSAVCHVLSALQHVGAPGLVQRQMTYSAVGGRFLQFIQLARNTVACLHVMQCAVAHGYER